MAIAWPCCAILRMLRFLADAMQVETRPNVIAKYKEQITADIPFPR
jgi:hypothetical protein